MTFEDDRRAADHRRPPAYLHEDEVARGGCAMCGAKRPKGRRRYCSERCGELADVPWRSRYAAFIVGRDLFGDDAHRCSGCGLTAHDAAVAHGAQPDKWGGINTSFYSLELDHVRPLWSLSAEERLELRWWLPGNLALLCHWCHAAKTAREAAERARLKRERVA